MSWQFWVASLLAVIAILTFIFGVLTRARRTVAASAVFAAFAGIVLLLGSFTVVGTRQVGIETSFGKPTGRTFGNGIHFKAPWAKVTEMDAAIQNDVYQGEHRIAVRLGNNSTAAADVNIRWNINQDAADELFQQYKTFDNVRSNLIERNLRTALNEAFTKFDPLAVPKEGQQRVDLNSVTLDSLNLMRQKSGTQVDILDLSIPIIDYDDQTEGRINAINGAIADTTRATQEAKTAAQRRLAAEELARQPVPNLQIAIAACVNKMAETGQSLNCFPLGTNVVPTLAVPNPGG